MVRHPALPERDRRILGVVVRRISSRGSRFRRSGWPRAGSGCRRRRCATCWRGSRNWASSASRTRRPAACRPIWATAPTSICCWPSAAVAERRTRSPAAPRRTVEECSRTPRRRCRARRTRWLRDRAPPTRRRSSTSISCRSTAACWSSSSRRAGRSPTRSSSRRAVGQPSCSRRPTT